jgi:hypothetical protein
MTGRGLGSRRRYRFDVTRFRDGGSLMRVEMNGDVEKARGHVGHVGESEGGC